MKGKNANLLNAEAYEAPKCETIEVQNEGIICASGNTEATHDPFNDSTLYEW
ncbi:hypothetical protein [uncultured Bacteroides sp.]|uniref:hypothetical protein n=1 Tax=uncultured Bacteroides sp. TaxID=162156 RepID=UPI0025D84BEF|nr:hypothetical protein [uncultured Bacteroides sp.]